MTVATSAAWNLLKSHKLPRKSTQWPDFACRRSGNHIGLRSCRHPVRLFKITAAATCAKLTNGNISETIPDRNRLPLVAIRKWHYDLLNSDREWPLTLYRMLHFFKMQLVVQLCITRLLQLMCDIIYDNAHLITPPCTPTIKLSSFVASAVWLIE